MSLHRFRTVALRLAMVAILPAVVLGFRVRAEIERDWSEMERVIERLASEREALSTEREALYGETVNERAWPHYARALERTIDAFPHGLGSYSFQFASTDAERADRDALLERVEPVFEAVRRGAHARDAETGLDWTIGLGSLPPSVHYLRVASDLTIARAHQQFELGDDLGGVRSLLDAAQLARDLASSSCVMEEMMGLGCLVPESIQVWIDRGGASTISKEARALWLSGLDRLSASLARDSRPMLGHLELVGRRYRRSTEPAAPEIRGVTVRWTGPDREPGWRNRYSWRHAASDLVLRSEEISMRAAAALSAPTVDAADALGQAFSDDANPLVRELSSHITSVTRSRRYCYGKLDFLRYALARGLDQERPLPRSPFGFPVVVERSDDALCLSTRTVDTAPLRIELGKLASAQTR